LEFLRFSRPRAKCAPITRYLRAQRAAIGQYKRREILSHTSAFRFKIYPNFRSLQALKEGEKIVFVFGPEGGIDEKEVAKLQKNEFHTCSLGPRILRAETAPLYALSALSYQCELLQ